MRSRPVQIAPSILSADFSALGRDIAAVERGGADLIHVDVMDGHFVPNITIGPPVVRAIKTRGDAAARRAPDDRGAGPLHRGVHRGRREHGLGPRRGGAASAPHHQLHQEARRKAGAVLNPATPAVALEDDRPRSGLRARDVGEPGLWRTGVHSAQRREASPCPRACWTPPARPPRSRSTAASTRRRRRRSSRPARPSSSPGNAIFGSHDPERATRALRAAASGTPQHARA